MAKNKRLEELQAKVDELIQRKAPIEAELSVAQGEFYQAEREFNRNEKPTPGMITVLAKMADGAKFHARTFAPYGYYWTNDEERSSVRMSVFLGLRSREAIDEVKANHIWTREYRITDHGLSLIRTNVPTAEGAQP